MINGSYLRELRKSSGFTLVQLSQEIGCTASFLSQMERGHKEPSLSTLRKLSEVLKAPIASFLLPEGDLDTHFSPECQPRFTVIRKEERAAFPELQHIAHYELVTPPAKAKNGNKLQGIIGIMQPGTFCAETMLIHPDHDELLLVLSGNVTALLDGEEFLLTPGDSIYVNAGTPHNFFNGTEAVCTLLSVSS